jgi:hypothetical protein
MDEIISYKTFANEGCRRAMVPDSPARGFEAW